MTIGLAIPDGRVPGQVRAVRVRDRAEGLARDAGRAA